MTEALRVTVVDDDLGDLKLIKRLYARVPDPVEVQTFQKPELALSDQHDTCDLILLDYMIPGHTGLSLLDKFSRRYPDTAIVLITGKGDEEIAREAIRQGAVDYVPKKSLSEASLERITRTGVETARMRVRLREKQAELETFAHMLVHDLRSPISALIGLHGLVKESIADNDFQTALTDLNHIGTSAEQMSLLIDSLSVHLSIEREPKYSQAPLGQVLDIAERALALPIRTSQAQLQRSGTDCMLYGDIPQLAQVLQNLIGNGIKYTIEGVPRISIDAHVGEDGAVTLSVSDHGIGIPNESRWKVFEPFKRLRIENARISGTGLGLATCRKVVARHGGQIWCTPDRASGTEICFTIPGRVAASAPARAGAHAAAAESPGSAVM